MADKLTALNIQVSGFLPAWCPACDTLTVDYTAEAAPIENERAVGWGFRPVVGCPCGVLAKLLSATGDTAVLDKIYELYAPESLIPMLVARKLRGELNSGATKEAMFHDWDFLSNVRRDPIGGIHREPTGSLMRATGQPE